MPEEKVGFYDAIKKIHEKTGFAKIHIGEILDEFSNVIEEAVIGEKKSFYLKNVGIIYPAIKTGKTVVQMNKWNDKKPELMWMPERWVCKFKVRPEMARRLLEVDPTEEQIEKIYRDE